VALARFDGVVLSALRETETALSTYAQDHERHAALQRALAAADLSLQETIQLRRAGKAPLLADLGEQQNALMARSAEQSAREILAQDQIALFLALGGGWQN
jgi:multidrug efflux system outer membrane protein